VTAVPDGARPSFALDTDQDDTPLIRTNQDHSRRGGALHPDP